MASLCVPYKTFEVLLLELGERALVPLEQADLLPLKDCVSSQFRLFVADHCSSVDPHAAER